MAMKSKRAQSHRDAVGRIFASRTAKGTFRYRIGPNGERIPLPKRDYGRLVRSTPGLIAFYRLG